MHPLRCGNAHDHAGYNGDKRLDIVVNAHGSGHEAALGPHDKQEGEEGGSSNDIDDFAGCTGAQRGPVDLRNVRCHKGHDHDAGKGKRPLVEREGVILADYSREIGQIEGIAHLRDEDEQVAAKVGGMATGCRGGARDEQNRAREAHNDAQGTARGNALVQNEGREDERENGHRGQLDGGVDGRGEAQPHNIATLRHDEAKEAGPDNLQQVATLDALLRHKDGPYPEEEGSTANPEGHQLGSRDASIGQDVLGKSRHQPKQHHRQQHGTMSPQVLVVLPCVFCHLSYSPQNYYFYLQ